MEPPHFDFVELHAASDGVALEHVASPVYGALRWSAAFFGIV
jgi:hypothetical protein